MPCPPEVRNVLLAERFHTTPWAIEAAPADRVLRYMHVLSIEGEVRELTTDLPDDEPLFRDEGDD